MLGLHDLLSFVLAATAVIVVPGPATLYVASAARHSARRAVHAAAGIVTGDLVLITLSGLGFAALVARWPAVLSTIKLAGALYLGYLGVGLLRAPPGVPDRAAAPVASSRIWLKGLGITLTNPKPLMFFGAFFAMFIEPTAPSRIASFYALGALFELINVAYFAAIIGAIVRLRATDGFARFAAGRFNRVCGAGLLIYALVIAATLVR
jgi:leucine efflux protein